METDSGFPMLSCRCSVEWLATYNNLVEYDQQLHNDDRNASSFVEVILEEEKSYPKPVQLEVDF